jgi:hypothetical protein
MLELTVDSIKDFQTCERMYDFKYGDKLYEKFSSQELLEKKFENTLRKIFYFFWYKKQAEVVPSYASLLNKWEKLWIPKGTDSYDISTEQHIYAGHNQANMTSRAAAILMDFHEKYADMPVIPLAIADEYIAPVNKKAKINDVFDLIISDNGKVKVVKLLFGYRASKRNRFQIDFASYKVGFHTRHPARASSAAICYIDFLSDDLNIKEYEIFENDIEVLKHWCDRICDTDVFISKRDLIQFCSKCSYYGPCGKWELSN